MIEREDLGMVLHTSLRKFCDSDATSIAYNAIQHMDNRIWKVYLDILWEELVKVDSRKGKTYYAYIKCVKDTSCALDNYLVWDKYEPIYNIFKKKPIQKSLYYILICSFKLFNEEDWDNYAYYVFNDE